MQICGNGKQIDKKKNKSNLLIQNQELLRLRLSHEEKVFYTELFYDNAVGGKVLKNNFLPLLGMLGTQIAEEFAERIFLAFSSNKKEITLCEYLKYIDIYHYGDDRERCRVTCKLMDKKSTGIIKLEDFKSYINLIMNAVKKVNGGSDGALMSDQDVRDLFYHISKDKESFTYQEFENIYKEKPELVSWFDYFKNNKEDMLLIINQNVKNLLNLINEFLSSFMAELFNVLENDEEKELDLSVFIQKVYYYSNELEKVRKKFLKKISRFNIRTTFDKLQNNNKNQKTTDLINALQKKIFNNDEHNSYNKNFSSSFMISAIEPTEKKNERLKVASKVGNSNTNTFQSFKTINLSNKNNNIEGTTNIGMTRFFKKIKNNLERTLSNKNEKKNEKNNDFSNNNIDIKEVSSSEEENEDEDNKEILGGMDISSPKKNNNSGLNEGKGNNSFAQNFIKQQTMFGNKFFKFGAGKGGKQFGNENSDLGIVSQKRQSIFITKNMNLNIDDDIKEVDEEFQNEENSFRRNSQDFSRDMPSYPRIKNQILKKIQSELINNNNLANDAKSKTKKSKKSKISITFRKNENNSRKDLISDDSLYDKSDYEKTVRCGTIVESDTTEINSKDTMKKKENKENKSRSIRKVKTTREKKQKNKNNNNKNNDNKNNDNKNNDNKNNVNINISYVNNPNYIPKSKVKKYILKIKHLEQKANGLNQLLFCSRVAIENALDVCQTISSCYKWVGENYLDSQIKKVIKEAKLKEKQKEDKEKYGNIGNVPKKVTPAKKKIIRASDQSFKLL